ncbi:hypothetical protein [Sphingomonas hengshuiensis]|uniref:Uncharacterized protein n=1 Tax=Sphingomonas hengshuiensis TaxID=1609977 RepID=A0A7U4J780_9SPHN|nr:hypothetical protein [Sphingomonas hengshuiensis]AJP71531.1 hypothetical protein TS85_06680 [Sphingomonas hengshuiensis]
MRSLVIFAGIALTGCTQNPTRYPSLLPRPIESQSMAEPVRTPAVATPDAALESRLPQILAEVETADRAFAVAAGEAEAKIAVARGLPAGSGPWLDAQAALSRLETLRAPTLTTLSDLERMVLDRGQAGLPAYPALDSTVAKVDATVTAQGDRIGALEAALAGA